jgi:hypothetical protein
LGCSKAFMKVDRGTHEIHRRSTLPADLGTFRFIDSIRSPRSDGQGRRRRRSRSGLPRRSSLAINVRLCVSTWAAPTDPALVISSGGRDNNVRTGAAEIGRVRAARASRDTPLLPGRLSRRLSIDLARGRLLIARLQARVLHGVSRNPASGYSARARRASRRIGRCTRATPPVAAANFV